MPNTSVKSLDRTVLILGAPGLVGAQVTRQVALELRPEKIVIAALDQHDINKFADEIRADLPDEHGIKFEPAWGNIFVRSEFAKRQRTELVASSKHRRALFEDLFGSFSEAYARSEIVPLLSHHQPDVIIDCVNTATGISYQDVETSCKEVRKGLDFFSERVAVANLEAIVDGREAIEQGIEMLLVSQSVSQIIRHIRLLHKAMVDNQTQLQAIAARSAQDRAQNGALPRLQRRPAQYNHLDRGANTPAEWRHAHSRAAHQSARAR